MTKSFFDALIQQAKSLSVGPLTLSCLNMLEQVADYAATSTPSLQSRISRYFHESNAI